MAVFIHFLWIPELLTQIIGLAGHVHYLIDRLQPLHVEPPKESTKEKFLTVYK